eukprot:TRINITY_DN5748_c0_g1_i1.p1 TRINITY_DN5748_c0_g1~~TRINITY_DN5748_c0_g1_i1.p1  ORF type:complete len:367 (-),score=125.73 TRINITY_DN5748_c0_g1_i1:66-1166(-)
MQSRTSSLFRNIYYAASHHRSFASSSSSSSSVEATVYRFSRHGSIKDVLKPEKQNLATELKPNEVFVRMEAAPINPADINLIEGSYGGKINVPGVPGIEGVGSIAAVGSNVHHLRVNDRVIPSSSSFGTWRTHAVVKEDEMMKVPNDIPLHYSAVLSVNPSTALRLLEDFANLKAGDVIIQNGANSMVGLSVIQIAKSLGIKTINIIRDRPDYEHTVNLIKGLGGDVACTEKYIRTPAFKSLISELPAPKLALNCTGGSCATEIARHLGDGGCFVTYGAMSKQPVNLPASLFIFKNISSHGFWLSRWVDSHSQEERKQMIEKLSNFVKDGKLKLFMEGHKFSQFNFAMERHMEPYRDRKVVLELMH